MGGETAPYQGIHEQEAFLIIETDRMIFSRHYDPEKV